MKKIQMVDLVSQYEKIKPQVQSAINNILDKAQFINGPDVQEFKAELESYLGAKHVIPCANGTDALQIAMMALGLKPGDEVITPSYTYIATTEVIGLLGLKPVFVDCEKDTFNISPKAIEAAITRNTKAIVPVHLYGQSCDMESILKIAKKYDLKVIEDNAQAIGAEYTFSNGSVRKTGTIGDIGCTSFFPSKNLGCYGDGGAIFTNNDDLAEKITSIANHGMEVRYYHDRIGVNSRLDTIQASVLRTKLPHLDNYNKARRKAADYYDKAFENCSKIKTPTRSKFSTHTFHQYTLVLNNVDRKALMEHLSSKGIASAVYYPVALHNQKAFQDFKYNSKDFPVTDKLCESVISLPMNTELDDKTLKYICDSVLEFVEKNHS